MTNSNKEIHLEGGRLTSLEILDTRPVAYGQGSGTLFARQTEGLKLTSAFNGDIISPSNKGTIILAAPFKTKEASMLVNGKNEVVIKATGHLISEEPIHLAESLIECEPGAKITAPVIYVCEEKAEELDACVLDAELVEAC